MKRALRVVALLFVLGLIFTAGYVRLPYYAVGPGPAREVEPLIDIQGHTRYPSSGKLIMTTVRWFQVTSLQAIVAWLDPNASVVPSDTLYPPGEDVAVEQERALSQMDQSKIDASYVALSHVVDYPKDHGDGALIQSVGDRCPAGGKLFAGDTITSIDETPVGSVKDASKLIGAASPGEKLTFEVHAAGETHDIKVAKGDCPPSKDPLIGVSLVNAFPFPVSIASGDIGGPSAGLMFALGLYDELTPGDLTAGRTIAGTGTIDTTGNVGPIGGITDKVVAAERVGAQVFLVPKDNMAELRGVDTGDMRLIPVGSFDQALTALSAP
jgi:PDZ domain-containing protein